MKAKTTKEGRALRQAKAVMREADKYLHGKYNLSVLSKISYITCALSLFTAIISNSDIVKIIAFITAALQFANGLQLYVKQGFLELIDSEYEIKSRPDEGV